MEYKLVVDSCCDLTPSLKEELGAEAAPFSMVVDGVNYIDAEQLEISHFLKAMKASKHVPKSACPSPDQFLEKLSPAANNFIVTISSKLSGAYQSAVMAREFAAEKGQRVHVFDSLSASAGEVCVALKLKECIEQQMDFDAIVEKVTAFIGGMKTFFILESLDNLIKNGRMNKIVGYVASVMSMRPIMGADHGEIKLVEKCRGSVRAFTRLVDIIGESGKDFSDRTLVISHCNNERQAHFLSAEAQRRYHFKEVRVVPTRGLASMYANDGGVVIAF